MDSYIELCALPEGTLVEDATGRVWEVNKVRGETWLCPFSDEYSFEIQADGTTYALGDTPALPIRELPRG